MQPEYQTTFFMQNILETCNEELNTYRLSHLKKIMQVHLHLSSISLQYVNEWFLSKHLSHLSAD